MCAGRHRGQAPQQQQQQTVKVRAPTVFWGSGGEIYTVFDEESESEVENLIFSPGPRNLRNSKKN